MDESILEISGGAEIKTIIGMMETFGILKDVSVLDLGCKDGYISYLLYDTARDVAFRQMTGVDIVECEYKEQPYSGYRDYNLVARNFIKTDCVSYLKTATDVHDVVIINNVLHFLSHEQLNETMCLLPGVMSSNSFVFIEMFNENAKEEIETGYCNSVFNKEIQQKILTNFQIISCVDHSTGGGSVNVKTQLLLRKT